MKKKESPKPSVRLVRFSGELRLMRDRWYTADEVALMFRVARRSVFRWLTAGELVGYKLGPAGAVRIKGDAIMHFLRPCRKRAVRYRRPLEKMR